MNLKFPKDLTKKWEDNDGINFAVALSRITGWLLQVDWISPTQNEIDERKMISLRSFVADNNNLIFDLSGIYKIEDFYNTVINPIAARRNTIHGGGIATKFYSEEKYFNLPLRFKPDEGQIIKNIALIEANFNYIESIPKRNNPIVPAHQAGNYTFGKCNPFAEAMHEIKGCEAVALIAKQYKPIFSGSKLGYVHSFNLVDDQTGIDVWGKDSINNIADRFGLIDFELSKIEHQKVTTTLKNNSPKEYKILLKKSSEIINDYF